MVLNYIWVAFFLIAFVVALFKFLILGDGQIFPALMTGVFEMAKTGFEISLGLTGMLTLWLGIMKIGEKSGMVAILARLIGPFFHKLFPEIPKNHPVVGQILMNFAANMLGLDNAATPLGLKAMQGMQDLNPIKDTASNAQIMFLVLNTAGLTIIPLSIITYRTQMGAADPSDVFIPLLISTFSATFVGMVAVCIYQRINLFDKVLLTYIIGFLALMAGVIYYFSSIPKDRIGPVSAVASNFFIFTLIISFICLGVYKKIHVFDTFVEGAKEGFDVAIKLIPYMIAMLVAISVFRTCGAMDYIIKGLSLGVEALGWNADFIPAMPTALMKPLSSGGARSLTLETMKVYGADSFAGRLASILQSSSDTTFFILAVYFGSVNIKKIRYSVTCGLIADLASTVFAILVAYLFFH